MLNIPGLSKLHSGVRPRLANITSQLSEMTTVTRVDFPPEGPSCSGRSRRLAVVNGDAQQSIAGAVFHPLPSQLSIRDTLTPERRLLCTDTRSSKSTAVGASSGGQLGISRLPKVGVSIITGGREGTADRRPLPPFVYEAGNAGFPYSRPIGGKSDQIRCADFPPIRVIESGPVEPG